MPIDWKVIHSKKKSKGTSPGCYYEVKHHRGNGWMGTRFIAYAQLTHTVGPFKHKEECMQALETIDALVTPEVFPYRQLREYQKLYLHGAMYGTSSASFLKGVKK